MTDQATPGNVPLSAGLGPLYAKRDHEAQGEHYMRHIMAMTAEGLHAKSAIAGELAHRDIKNEALTRQLSASLDGRVEAVAAERERWAKLCTERAQLLWAAADQPHAPEVKMQHEAVAMAMEELARELRA